MKSEKLGISLANATFKQRLLAGAVNLVVLVLLGLIAERIATDPAVPNTAARAFVAAKALFGLTALFWLGCAQMRSSPGLAVLKLRLVRVDSPAKRVPLTASLARPLPFFVFGMLAIFPVQLISARLAPVQFIGVIVSALFLAANAAPVWSTPERRSLMDKWLGMRVVGK